MARSYKRTITLGLDYSEFSGGVTECNNKMKLLDAEFALAQSEMNGVASASDKLALKQDMLTQKFNVQQQKTEIARKKYEALMEAHADTSKIDKAHIAFDKEQKKLNELKTELVETTVEQGNLKESTMALVGTMAAISGALIKAAKDTAEYADEMLTLSTNTGVSTKTLQEWEYASELIDVSLDTMTGACAKLTKTMASANDKSSESGKLFKQLGVNVKDAHGQMREADVVFMETIDALGQIENKTQRDQMAMQLFGKSAQELSGLIATGSEGMKAYADEAEKLGRIMSDEELAKAGEFDDAMVRLNNSFEALSHSAGMAVIPMLTDLLNIIASIPTPVLKSITVIVSIIATIAMLAKTINSVISTGKSVLNLIKLFSGAADPLTVKILSITAVVLGVVAAITALVAAIAVLSGKGKQMERTFQSMTNYGGSVGNTRQQVGHNANGTQNWRGGLTMVGEEGPELVNLPQGSRIYNNNETRMMGNKTYNVSMNLDITKLRSVNDVINAVEGLKMTAECGGV